MVTKYWTVKDGVVGTAHLSRKGLEVDFRPASRVRVWSKTVEFSTPDGQQIDALELPYEIVKTKLGYGSSPHLEILEVRVEFKGLTQILNVEGNWYLRDAGPITTQSQALHDAWVASIQEKMMADEAANRERLAAEKEAATKLCDRVAEAWPSLSSQQRRWMKRFIRNVHKSQEQAERILWNISPQGYRGFLMESSLSTLAEKLGERLNIQ